MYIHSLETKKVRTCQEDGTPKGNESEPTIHFQRKNVGFREGTPKSIFTPFLMLIVHASMLSFQATSILLRFNIDLKRNYYPKRKVIIQSIILQLCLVSGGVVLWVWLK